MRILYQSPKSLSNFDNTYPHNPCIFPENMFYLMELELTPKTAFPKRENRQMVANCHPGPVFQRGKLSRDLNETNCQDSCFRRNDNKKVASCVFFRGSGEIRRWQDYFVSKNSRRWLFFSYVEPKTRSNAQVGLEKKFKM